MESEQGLWSIDQLHKAKTAGELLAFWQAFLQNDDYSPAFALECIRHSYGVLRRVAAGLDVKLNLPPELAGDVLQVDAALLMGKEATVDEVELRNVADTIIACCWELERNQPGCPPSPKKAIHSLDHTDVWWFGKRYTFSKTQAAAVKLLWSAWEAGTPTVRGESITADSSVDTTRTLADVFRSHPAWGTMIVASKAVKGAYSLADPNDPVLQVAREVGQQTRHKTPSKRGEKR